jgi:hypothetical protein
MKLVMTIIIRNDDDDDNNNNNCVKFITYLRDGWAPQYTISKQAREIKEINTHEIKEKTKYKSVYMNTYQSYR